MQTGGSRRTWVFDHNDVDSFPALRDVFVHYDEYFFEEPVENVLAIVLDKLFEELPEEQADAVRLVYLKGKSYRAAGKILGVDHKTVKARCIKGVANMKSRLVDSVWIGEMLRGYIPADEVRPVASTPASSVVDIVRGIKNEAGREEVSGDGEENTEVLGVDGSNQS